MASCSFSALLERVTACGLSCDYSGHVEAVSLKECTRDISRHLSADEVVDSECKLLLMLLLFVSELLCSIILDSDTS